MKHQKRPATYGCIPMGKAYEALSNIVKASTTTPRHHVADTIARAITGCTKPRTWESSTAAPPNPPIAVAQTSTIPMSVSPAHRSSRPQRRLEPWDRLPPLSRRQPVARSRRVRSSPKASPAPSTPTDFSSAMVATTIEEPGRRHGAVELAQPRDRAPPPKCLRPAIVTTLDVSPYPPGEHPHRFISTGGPVRVATRRRIEQSETIGGLAQPCTALILARAHPSTTLSALLDVQLNPATPFAKRGGRGAGVS